MGLLGKPNTEACIRLLEDSSKLPLRPDEDRPYIAVASHEGVLVNQHLGEAKSLWIYRAEDGVLVEHRLTPPVGGGDSRWTDMAESLNDCATLLVAGIGPRPMETLAKAGLRITVMEGVIQNTLEDIRCGIPIKSPVRKFKCGASCAGTGTGCG